MHDVGNGADVALLARIDRANGDAGDGKPVLDRDRNHLHLELESLLGALEECVAALAPAGKSDGAARALSAASLAWQAA